MRVRNHIIISAGLSLGLHATIYSWPATLGCFFSGILIDIDHCFEYYFHHGRFPHGYKELLNFCVPYKEKKIYLIFHAHEYVLVLWLLIYFWHLGAMWLGLAIGLTVHMICDQFTNPIKPLFYFLAFRIKNQFETTKTLAPAAYRLER